VLNPGTYIFDQGAPSVNGQATLTGDRGDAALHLQRLRNQQKCQLRDGDQQRGANVTLSAPTSGALAGILWFGDRNMPVGTSFKLNGGSTQSFDGATYISEGALQYAGGANGTNLCTPIVADTISFVGTSYLSINCKGKGTKLVGGSAKVAE
jgi:hypothetical protein